MALASPSRACAENRDRLDRLDVRGPTSMPGDVLFATNGYTTRGAVSAAALRPDRQLHHRDRAARRRTGPRRSCRAAGWRSTRSTSCTISGSRPIGRLLFGGRAEFSRPDTRDDAAAPRRSCAATWSDVFPQLAGHRIDYAWGGNVAFTRDQMPHAGKLERSGTMPAATAATASRWRRLWAKPIARRIAGEAIEHPLFDDRFPAIPLYSRQSVVSAVGRRLLQGEGLASVDLEFTTDQMRAMADAVVARCIDHIATLPAQPSCGDVDWPRGAVPRR